MPKKRKHDALALPDRALTATGRLNPGIAVSNMVRS